MIVINEGLSDSLRRALLVVQDAPNPAEHDCFEHLDLKLRQDIQRTKFENFLETYSGICQTEKMSQYLVMYSQASRTKISVGFFKIFMPLFDD